MTDEIWQQQRLQGRDLRDLFIYPPDTGPYRVALDEKLNAIFEMRRDGQGFEFIVDSRGEVAVYDATPTIISTEIENMREVIGKEGLPSTLRSQLHSALDKISARDYTEM